MNRQHQRDRVLIYKFILSLFFSFGLALPVHRLLALTFRPFLILGITAAGSLLCFLFGRFRKSSLLLNLILWGISIASFYPYRSKLGAILSAISLGVGSENKLALAAYSLPLTIFISITAVILANFFSYDESSFPVILIFSLPLFYYSALNASVADTLCLIPLMFAVFLASKDIHAASLPTVINSLVVFLLAFLLLPHLSALSPRLADGASSFRQFVDDYFLFNDSRVPFSLSSTGWQPLGSKLGGPADPTDEEVMMVAASGPLLLRGSIRDTYNGYAWGDTIGGRRYLYIDPRFTRLRNNLFDRKRPASEIQSAFPAEEHIQVYFESEGTSTLYLTQRFNSLSGKGLVPYFSPSSEVFATRSLVSGDQYDFYGTRLTADTPGVRALVLAASEADEWETENISNYLEVPETVEDSVYTLADTITADARTNFDRALAISTYLQTSFPYTLDQDYPPSNRDFVSWFLLEEKKGYCTSFASSMVILARILGIPARYIEGYSVHPENGIAHVTNQNGHAWCEIYFSGFGWLPFDPTPADDSSGGQSDSSGEGSSDPDSTPTPEPTNSPVPSIRPTETPAPSSSPAPSPAPEQATETPTPSPVPTSVPEENDSKINWLLLLPLILLLLLLLATLRAILVSPSFVASRQPDSNLVALVWYSALLEALAAMHIMPLPGEAPVSFLKRAQTQLKQPVQLSDMERIVMTAGYSKRRPGSKQIERAERIYRRLIRHMPFVAKMRMYKNRFLHGLPIRSLTQ